MAAARATTCGVGINIVSTPSRMNKPWRGPLSFLCCSQLLHPCNTKISAGAAVCLVHRQDRAAEQGRE